MRKTGFLALAVFFMFTSAALSEETTGAKETAEKSQVIDVDYLSNAVSKAYQKAILHIDAQKALKKAKDDEELNARLDSFLDERVKEQVLNRQGGLNGIVEQEWEKTITSLPHHMDYYLRDFSYAVQQKDIKESESVTNPYRAAVLIKETLYVERGPLIAEPRAEYRYTALMDINIALDYDKSQDAWQVVDIKEGIVALEKGWPEEVAKKVGMYFIPGESK